MEKFKITPVGVVRKNDRELYWRFFLSLVMRLMAYMRGIGLSLSSGFIKVTHRKRDEY